MPTREAEFFAFARERYLVMMLKNSGLPPPWTDDPVLRAYRFCNVFREHDKTTVWFRKHVRDRLRLDGPESFVSTLVFRWFNRIETAKRIEPMLRSGRWDEKHALRELRGVAPVVTGAYIVKTPNGMPKLDGVCWCIRETLKMRDAADWATGIRNLKTLENAHTFLLEAPYLGRFMAYEIVTDLRHTTLLRDAPDIDTWANPGPGARRGLAHVTGDGPFSSSTADVKRCNQLMQLLLAMSKSSAMWPADWPRWEMREVEHTLCEYDKYVRGCNGERLKRRFKAE